MSEQESVSAGEDNAGGVDRKLDVTIGDGGESESDGKKASVAAAEDGEGPGEERVGGRWPTDRLKPVVEALVFASGDALPVKQMTAAIEGASRGEILDALTELKNECATRGLRLVEVAGGWQFRTAAEHHLTVRKLFKERPYRLTRAAVETASIVAYRQPVIRHDIERIRGVDCGGVLESLVEKKLLRVAGRLDVPGRPLLYATTSEFLELFGLGDLKELPALAELGDDIVDLAERSEFNDNPVDEAKVLPLDDEDSEREEQKGRSEERPDDESTAKLGDGDEFAQRAPKQGDEEAAGGASRDPDGEGLQAGPGLQHD